MTDVLCLDANILVKLVIEEDPPELTVAAVRLYARVQAMTAVLVAPAFAWAEVGSTLRKKVRIRELSGQRAQEHWEEFIALPVDYLDTPEAYGRAWELADRYTLPTLYDAAYLACTELAPLDEPGAREFWTADQTLIAQLGARRPAYVHRLGE